VLDETDDLIVTELRGSPIAGDFDGDGQDDLGTWRVDVFSFDLANDGFGDLDDTINFGFPGVAEKPVAADMDQDGIDDVGLFVPRRSGTTPEQDSEWYFLLSNDFEERDENGEGAVAFQQSVGTVDALDHPFSPAPLGQDLFAQWGDEFAIPIVGNFDPPVAQRSTQLAATTEQLGAVHAPQQVSDLNVSGGKWISFKTLRDGTATVTVDGGTGGQVRLYDFGLQTLATGTIPLGGATQVSESLAAGEYFAYIVGGTGSASIEVANNIAPSDLYDVTRDGHVLPQDVLSIIDDLHRNGFRAIDVANVTAELYFDTSLDGQLTPQDVLSVLDYISRRAQDSAGGLLSQLESSEQAASSGQVSPSFLFLPDDGGDVEPTLVVPKATAVVQPTRETDLSSRPTAGGSVALGGFTRSVASRGHVTDEAFADEEDWLSPI
jgi:hypothetical protein